MSTNGLKFNRSAFEGAVAREGISLREVARRIGIAHPAILRWRDGGHDPQLKHAIALATVLGVRVEDLWSVVQQAEEIGKET